MKQHRKAGEEGSAIQEREKGDPFHLHVAHLKKQKDKIR